MPDETNGEASRSRDDIGVLESRRTASDSFAWTVPGLALAAQAFLLTIALAPDTQPAGRVVASLVGAAAMFATIVFFAKHVYYFALYDASIWKLRKETGATDLRPHALARWELPIDADVVRDGWLGKTSKSVILRMRPSRTWVAVLALFFILDVVLFGYGIVVWAGRSPGWFEVPDR